MKYAWFVFAMFILVGCENGDDGAMPEPGELKGKWIEVKTKTDTLTFESWDAMEIMKLSRAKEVQNGLIMPGSATGPYQYKFIDDKISLYWLLSSNSNFRNYNFGRRADTLWIENFYGSNSGSTLTFTRIR